MHPLDEGKMDLAGPPPDAHANGTHTGGALVPYGPVLEEVSQRLTSPPVALSTTPTALGLLKALRRRWFLAGTVGLLGATLAGVGVWFLPMLSKSSASSLVHLASSPPRIMFESHESQSAFTNYQATQAAMVKNRRVLDAALSQPQVASLPLVHQLPDPASWLDRELKTDFLLGPEMLRITLAGDRPEDLRVLVQAVTEAYLHFSELDEHDKRVQRLNQLTAFYNEKQTSLEVKRGVLRQRTKDTQGQEAESPEDKKRRATDRLDHAEKELFITKLELAKAQEGLANLKRRDKPAAEPGVPEYLVLKDIDERLAREPFVQALLLDMARVQRDIRVLEKVAVGNTVALTKLQDELVSLEQAVNTRKTQLRPIAIAELHEKFRAESQAKQTLLEDQILGLQARQKLQEAAVERAREESSVVKRGAADLESLVDDISKLETLFRKTGEELEAAKVELNAPARVTLGQEAVIVPKDEKKQLQVAGVAGLGVLGLALFGVSWLEFRARRVNTLDEVVYGLGLRLLGALPQMPDRVRTRMLEPKTARDLHWHNLLTESVDATRTMLIHAARSQSLQTVMVTSAVEGEGKTTLASHLAASLARAGLRTLLIDCDLRKPAVHRLLNVPLAPGFNELLRAEATLNDVIRPTSVGGLWMIPGGKWDGQSPRALAQERVRTIFTRLQSHYDFIVIDSSPVLPVTDSLLIGQHVDAVVFSILRDVSRMPTVYAAYQRLESLGIRLLGAVVNGAAGDRYSTEYQDLTSQKVQD